SLIAARVAEREIPEKVSIRDMVLFGLATHKITLIATKDWVTAPLRAPFTRYEKSLGSGEVAETSRGDGLQRAIGDLLTCPWCSGPWIAGALFTGFLINPKAARLLASMFSSVAVSDWLHHAYGAMKRIPPKLDE
ncbi:MAG: DUF1360 domain-containing protein, partial [Thermoanaerobaculia bacterium]|nr:DUF1360 domain-containing protein [Thermoanaerobaculia bacterium]